MANQRPRLGLVAAPYPLRANGVARWLPLSLQSKPGNAQNIPDAASGVSGGPAKGHRSIGCSAATVAASGSEPNRQRRSVPAAREQLVPAATEQSEQSVPAAQAHGSSHAPSPAYLQCGSTRYSSVFGRRFGRAGTACGLGLLSRMRKSSLTLHGKDGCRGAPAARAGGGFGATSQIHLSKPAIWKPCRTPGLGCIKTDS